MAYSVKPLPSVSALRKGAGCRKTAHVLIPVPMWESGSELMASEWPAPAAAGTGGHDLLPVTLQIFTNKTRAVSPRNTAAEISGQFAFPDSGEENPHD